MKNISIEAFMRGLAVLLLTLCVGAGEERPPGNHIPAKPMLALLRATSYTLISLNPRADERPWRLPDNFHGFDVYGQAIFSDPADMRLIRETLLKAVAEYDEGDATCCFNPRHAVRALFDAKAYDFVVCYECARLEINCGNKRLKVLGGFWLAGRL